MEITSESLALLYKKKYKKKFGAIQDTGSQVKFGSVTLENLTNQAKSTKNFVNFPMIKREENMMTQIYKFPGFKMRNQTL